VFAFANPFADRFIGVADDVASFADRPVDVADRVVSSAFLGDGRLLCAS